VVVGGAVVVTVVGAVVVTVVGAVVAGAVRSVGLVATVFSVRPAFAATGREDPQAANVSSGKRTPATANA
jgi:hypothetical protein